MIWKNIKITFPFFCANLSKEISPKNKIDSNLTLFGALEMYNLFPRFSHTSRQISINFSRNRTERRDFLVDETYFY
jgi:hypothetical protein